MDGSEDDLIECFKAGHPCHDALSRLCEVEVDLDIDEEHEEEDELMIIDEDE